METLRLGKPEAKHLYELEVIKDNQKTEIKVDANNRTQAASIAEKAGFKVGSVNMIG